MGETVKYREAKWCVVANGIRYQLGDSRDCRYVEEATFGASAPN